MIERAGGESADGSDPPRALNNRALHEAASPPPKLDSVTFDQLLARQGSLDTGAFDLAGTAFVSPAGLVSLAVALQHASRNANDVTMRVTDPALRTYLARAGLLANLPRGCRVVPESSALSHAYDHRRGKSPLLIELTPIDDVSTLEGLLGRTIACVERVRGRRNDALDLAALVSELGANVLEHGGGRGYLALQVYGSGADTFLELAIGDAGEGIRQSLHRNPGLPRYADDLQAISDAVRARVSGSSEPSRGSGLYQLLRLVVLEHGGGVQIRSGAAKARWRAGRSHGSGFAVTHMSGTQITVSVPAP